MPLNPGNVVLTFSPPGDFVVDKYHTAPASAGLTAFTQPGCAAQTVKVSDKITDTAYADATHAIYTPWNTNTDGVEAEWMVQGSKNYRVLGAHKTHDAWNRCYQIHFVCKEEHG